MLTTTQLMRCNGHCPRGCPPRWPACVVCGSCPPPSARAALRRSAYGMPAPASHRIPCAMDRSRLHGIVHVVNSLDYGGLERVVADLAIEQRRRGMDVRVLSICDTGGFRDALEAAGVPVTVAGKSRTFDLRVLRLLRTSVAGADIVHSHNFVPNYYAATALLGLRRRPRLVNTCHNMGTRLDNRRLRLLYRCSLRRTARVAMVGEQVRQRFVDGGIVPAPLAATVLNGIPVQRF